MYSLLTFISKPSDELRQLKYDVMELRIRQTESEIRLNQLSIELDALRDRITQSERELSVMRAEYLGVYSFGKLRPNRKDRRDALIAAMRGSEEAEERAPWMR